MQSQLGQRANHAHVLRRAEASHQRFDQKRIALILQKNLRSNTPNNTELPLLVTEGRRLRDGLFFVAIIDPITPCPLADIMQGVLGAGLICL